LQAAQQVVALAQSRLLTPDGSLVLHSNALLKLTVWLKFLAPLRSAPNRQARAKLVP
jgi:hypothetical protein